MHAPAREGSGLCFGRCAYFAVSARVPHEITPLHARNASAWRGGNARAVPSRAQARRLHWQPNAGAAGVEERSMSDEANRPTPESEPIPLGQRLFDRPFLLLAACIVVMFVFYTGWGLLELASLTEAPLP